MIDGCLFFPLTKPFLESILRDILKHVQIKSKTAKVDVIELMLTCFSGAGGAEETVLEVADSELSQLQ